MALIVISRKVDNSVLWHLKRALLCFKDHVAPCYVLRRCVFGSMYDSFFSFQWNDTQLSYVFEKNVPWSVISMPIRAEPLSPLSEIDS